MGAYMKAYSKSHSKAHPSSLTINTPHYTPSSFSSSLHSIIFLSLSDPSTTAFLCRARSLFFSILTQRLQISTCFAMHGSTRLITVTPALPRRSATKHVFACHFLQVVWHSPPPLPLSRSFPLTATAQLSRIFRWEHWQSAETEITLHPEEASDAHHQVPEALHLEAEYDLLTAVPEAEAMLQGTRPYTFCEDVIVFFFSLLVAAMFLLSPSSFLSSQTLRLYVQYWGLPVFCSSIKGPEN